MKDIVSRLRLAAYVMFHDGQSSGDLAEEAAKEIEMLKGVATDYRYMLAAYRAMLGPVAVELVERWDEEGFTRVHTDWTPEALLLTGEERAQALLDVYNAPSTPLDFLDSSIPTADFYAKLKGEDKPS